MAPSSPLVKMSHCWLRMDLFDVSGDALILPTHMSEISSLSQLGPIKNQCRVRSFPKAGLSVSVFFWFCEAGSRQTVKVQRLTCGNMSSRSAAEMEDSQELPVSPCTVENCAHLSICVELRRCFYCF